MSGAPLEPSEHHCCKMAGRLVQENTFSCKPNYNQWFYSGTLTNGIHTHQRSKPALLVQLLDLLLRQPFCLLPDQAAIVLPVFLTPPGHAPVLAVHGSALIVPQEQPQPLGALSSALQETHNSEMAMVICQTQKCCSC